MDVSDLTANEILLSLECAKSRLLIAEISANHQGTIENAKRLILQAKKAGADAVKLQTYTPDELVLESAHCTVEQKGSPWIGRKLWDLYQEGHTPYDWHQELFNYAASNGIFIFSAPFGIESLDLLEQLNCPLYKIASIETSDPYLVEKIAEKNKPIIFSTGTSKLDEVIMIVEMIRSLNDKTITILKCQTEYPSMINRSGVSDIARLIDLFPDCRIGFSDHCKSISASIEAIRSGATVIERHFSGDTVGGMDDEFSSSTSEFSVLKQYIDDMENIEDEVKSWPHAGSLFCDATPVGREGRRSLWFVRDLKNGHTIGSTDISCRRPMKGVPCSDYNKVVGKILKHPVTAGTPVQEELLMEILN